MTDILPQTTLAFFKLNVTDAEEAEPFYVRALGMQRQNFIDTPRFKEIMLTSKGVPFMLVLYESKTGDAIAPGTNYGPVGFSTSDLEASLKKILAHGAKQRGDIIEFGTARIIFATSPQGHELELLQRHNR